jgi:hypothetical protein
MDSRGVHIMELKFIFAGFMFFLLIGFATQIIAGTTPPDEKDIILAEATEDLGWVATGFITFGTGLFSIFGVDVFSGFVDMPTILVALISMFGTLLIVVFLLYVAEKIGQIIPFT